jgi:hypothetical protein
MWNHSGRACACGVAGRGRGERIVAGIVDDRAVRYTAARNLVAADVPELLQDVRDKGTIRL